MSYRTGVPRNYRQNWDYFEREKGSWKRSTIYQTKRRSRGNRVSSEGSFKVGTGIDWKRYGTVRTKRIGKNKWLEIIKYKKKPMGVKPRGKRWHRFSKRR